MFRLGSETILVVINGKEVKFGNTAFGNQLADISGLKLNYNGVCREFPDLEVREDWREEAIKRFKKNIKSKKTELEVYTYIVEDLKLHGYIPYLKKRRGFRPENL